MGVSSGNPEHGNRQCGLYSFSDAQASRVILMPASWFAHARSLVAFN
jgi:hypothetical protein